MLALQMDVSSTYDTSVPDKIVYAIDHAPEASARAKRAADILRDWDGRMSADSSAPTIETKARQELVRFCSSRSWVPLRNRLLSDPATLSWKSYRWAMSSVWLENVLTKQPPRWLPTGIRGLRSSLTAALRTL